MTAAHDAEQAAALAALAARMAARVFDERSKGKDRRNVEAHISETELTELLAMAILVGKSQPAPAQYKAARRYIGELKDQYAKACQRADNAEIHRLGALLESYGERW